MLAVFMLSAQTFIIITSQPSERPTSNLKGKTGANKKKRNDKIICPFNLNLKVMFFIASKMQQKMSAGKMLHLHGGAFDSSQKQKCGVRSGAVLCSCERSSSSHCPRFARAAAWMAGDLTPAWTTPAHLLKCNTSLNICPLYCCVTTTLQHK